MADRTRLVDRLRYERDARIDHALFYWTQVFMAYNSNHMEGSTLTPEQTRQIYDTGRLLADADEQIRLDDASRPGTISPRSTTSSTTPTIRSTPATCAACTPC